VVVELPNGELLSAWYAGEDEARPDAAVVIARKAPGGGWSRPPQIVADTPGKPEGNAVLWVNRRGRVQLFYGTMHGKLDGPPGPGVRWDTVDQKMKLSYDLGHTWGEDLMLREEWGCVFRTKPLNLQNGDTIIGVEYRTNHSLFLISEDDGDTWWYTGEVRGVPNQHPTMIQRSDGSILALLRPAGPWHRIGRTVSYDNGRTWERAVHTKLPNPGAAIDMVRLDDGRVILAHNPLKRGRNALALALSEDEGETFPVTRDLEREERGEFSYPAIIQDRSGRVHVTYTHMRTRIKHVCLTPDWVYGE
jgi:predicted neuraminidase